MCTAISLNEKYHCFGRTLDWESSYGERVTVTPRGVPLSFLWEGTLKPHGAMIGPAVVSSGFPLYFDAVNEYGLAAAGLHFPRSARYPCDAIAQYRVAPHEVIPWLLAQCRSVSEAACLMRNTAILAAAPGPGYEMASLHWIIADRTGSIVIEATGDGLSVQPMSCGVLTNDPPYCFQMENVSLYRALSPGAADNRLFPGTDLPSGGRGTGALGLPGDWTSMSRFVRAAFAGANAVGDGTRDGAINRAFHVLAAVAQPMGCVCAENGNPVRTVYTSCYDTERGICYYTTYENSCVHAVALSDSVDADHILTAAMHRGQDVQWDAVVKP